MFPELRFEVTKMFWKLVFLATGATLLSEHAERIARLERERYLLALEREKLEKEKNLQKKAAKKRWWHR